MSEQSLSKVMPARVGGAQGTVETRGVAVDRIFVGIDIGKEFLGGWYSTRREKSSSAAGGKKPWPRPGRSHGPGFRRVTARHKVTVRAARGMSAISLDSQSAKEQSPYTSIGVHTKSRVRGSGQGALAAGGVPVPCGNGTLPSPVLFTELPNPRRYRTTPG